MKHQLILSVISILLYSSCEKTGICKDDDLSLSKVNYNSTALRIDGYYFGDVNLNSSTPFANIYYLYRNGVFFTSEADDLDLATAGTISVDVENNFGKQVKALWGLFQINGNLIEIERWRSRTNGCETTIYEKGDILNDSTFVLTRREHRTNGETRQVDAINSVFNFRPLDQKPDSTNSFVD